MARKKSKVPEPGPIIDEAQSPTNPIQQALALIDDNLTRYAGRDMADASEFVDMLLDIRICVAACQSVPYVDTVVDMSFHPDGTVTSYSDSVAPDWLIEAVNMLSTRWCEAHDPTGESQ